MSPARYAQHFLIDESARSRIVESMGIDTHQAVLEIGPGNGALTGELLKRAGHVTAVEIDAQLVKNLASRWGKEGQFQLVHADILKFDLHSLTNPVNPSDPYVVAGNLPYNLTSPILRKLAGWDGWAKAVVMVQKEVGERICAAVGSPAYGALTVGVALSCRAEPLFDLGPQSFRPRPKVDSRVLSLVRRIRPLTADIAAAQRVIQAAFQQRRKTVLNSLSHGLSIPKKRAGELLQSTGVPETLRPERIPVETFVQLAETARKQSLI